MDNHDEVLLEKIDNLVERVFEHTKLDEKEFYSLRGSLKDHEKRIRHIENYVWLAIGAILILHGIADIPDIIKHILAK